MVFEFSAIGGVIPQIDYRTFTCKQTYTDTFATIGFGCEIAYALFVVFYICMLVRQWCFMQLEMFSYFWLLLDTLIIVVTLKHVRVQSNIQRLVMKLDPPMEKGQKCVVQVLDECFEKVKSCPMI